MGVKIGRLTKVSPHVAAATVIR